MKTRIRRAVLLLASTSALLVGGAAVLATTGASAASHDDGCHVWAEAPSYLNGKMHYYANTHCHHYEYALTQYIGNEWFKPGADTPSWSGSAKRTCGPNTVKYCSVSSKGPWKGPGLYCTVAMTDLWFVNRISYRSCANYG
jgi:hypothetical protein